MNPLQKSSAEERVLFKVHLPPPTITIPVSRWHPIFWWNRKHVRSVRIEPVLHNKIYEAQYTNTRTGAIFMHKFFADSYLHKKIPVPEYFGQPKAEQERKIFAYGICSKCGHIGCTETEAVFDGPFSTVTGPIAVTRDFPCQKCGVYIPTEISTEPSSRPIDTDCDWG